MDMLSLLCIVSAVFTGLTRGAGVLPDALNAAVGETVMFNTTLTPPATPFTVVIWNFGINNIITSGGSDTITPEYEGRITLFRSTGSLELRSVTVNDTGGYSVNIIPSEGATELGTTTLTVYDPVSNVVVTPSSTDLVEFSSVSLSCSSSGSSLSFLWLNGSSEVTPSDRVQLTDGGSTLTITNVTRYDQGPFRCHVSNPVSNSTSDPVNLSISYGPDNVHVIISPSQEYYSEGSDIILNCSADSRPAAQITWFLNGDLLADTGPELRLMNIQMSQSGNYSCQAFNNITLQRRDSQPATLSVLERISGASITSNTNLTIEGNSFNLTCDAAGSIFTRTWKKNDLDLTLDDDMKLYDNNRVLSFRNLSKRHTGKYLCEVSNPVSSDKAEFTMVVYYGPENVYIEVKLNDHFTLNCSADSEPAATFIWIRNGKEIHNSSVLTIDKTEENLGNYTCKAANHITGRTSSKAVVLNLFGDPDPPPCPGGCIAGIVIGILALCGLSAGGYYVYLKKDQIKNRFNRDTATGTGGVFQDNVAYTANEEPNYAEVKMTRNKSGGAVQPVTQNEHTEYAQIKVNNNPPAASSPPSYDVHLKRMGSSISSA